MDVPRSRPLRGKSEQRIQEEQKAKNGLVNLEAFYVNGQIDNLEELVEKRREELATMLEEYKKISVTNICDEEGNVVNTLPKAYNPYLVSTFFFKSINPLNNIDPDYSSEKLSIVWDLYMYLIEQVNIHIGVIQPTISHFCRFAGISVNKFKLYKVKGTPEMQTVVNKISDATFDSNISLAQNKMLANKSTELRVKVENEIKENPQVHLNVNVNEDVDLSQIASRLSEITSFKSTKSKMEQPIEVDNYEVDVDGE